MDEDKRINEKHWEEMLLAVILLFVLLSLFSALPNFISEKFGTDGTFVARVFGNTPALNADTPLGTAIVNKGETTLYSEPGGEPLGSKPKGAKGITIGGPVLRDGTLWWQVEYEDGSVGWVEQDDLGVDLERDRLLLKESTPHGTKVETTQSTDIYSTPDENGLVVGRASPGGKAVIIGGPRLRDGGRWWQVRFEDGTSGWVPENALQVDVSRNVRGVNDSTPLGTEIVTLFDTDVWDAPRLGRVVGEQREGAFGTLVDGSVTVGTSRWWEIDFENDPDGWVREENIERRFPLSEKASSSLATLKRISFIISIFFLVGIVYVFTRLRYENAKEYHLFKPLSVVPEEQEIKNSRWDRVMEHLNSDNPNDWRLAVLEADIILDDIVETMYLPGSTLGERLQRVERSDFETIDQAWEAHKMRNKLAHEGGDYVLTQREAKRIIGLYKQVFEEFHAI